MPSRRGKALPTRTAESVAVAFACFLFGFGLQGIAALTALWYGYLKRPELTWLPYTQSVFGFVIAAAAFLYMPSRRETHRLLCDALERYPHVDEFETDLGRVTVMWYLDATSLLRATWFVYFANRYRWRDTTIREAMRNALRVDPNDDLVRFSVDHRIKVVKIRRRWRSRIA